MGLFEFFRPDTELASAIAAGMPEQELAMLRRKHGQRTLTEDGLGKCLSGLTTLKEVYRVAGVY